MRGLRLAFDPDQARDESGRWTSGGGGGHMRGREESQRRRAQRDRSIEDLRSKVKRAGKLKLRLGRARGLYDAHEKLRVDPSPLLKYSDAKLKAVERDVQGRLDRLAPRLESATGADVSRLTIQRRQLEDVRGKVNTARELKRGVNPNELLAKDAQAKWGIGRREGNRPATKPSHGRTDASLPEPGRTWSQLTDVSEQVRRTSLAGIQREREQRGKGYDRSKYRAYRAVNPDDYGGMVEGKWRRDKGGRLQLVFPVPKRKPASLAFDPGQARDEGGRWTGGGGGHVGRREGSRPAPRQRTTGGKGFKSARADVKRYDRELRGKGWKHEAATRIGLDEEGRDAIAHTYTKDHKTTSVLHRVGYSSIPSKVSMHRGGIRASKKLRLEFFPKPGIPGMI